MENSFDLITLQDVENKVQQSRIAGLFSIVRPSLLRSATLGAEAVAGPVGLSDFLSQMSTADSVTVVAELPATILPSDMQNLLDISLLNSYSAVSAANLVYQNIKDISFEPAKVAEYQKKYAAAYFRVMTQGLSGLLPAKQIESHNFSGRYAKDSFHNDFLGELFKSFSLPDSALKQLDSILSSLSLNLSKVITDANRIPTDFLVVYYYFSPVEGMPELKIPSLRLFNIHIDYQNIERAVSKRQKETDFDFAMSYADYTGTLAISSMEHFRPILKRYVEDSTQKSLDEIQKMVQPKAIQG